MKKIFLFLSLMLLTWSCGNADTGKKPRIAIAGISIECSTFSPARTTEDMFRIGKGEELFRSYPFLSPDSTLRQQAEWLPAMTARATPGGMVTRETYESLVAQILVELKKNLPYDGLFFDIHGAMSVEGIDDPEGDLIVRIREVIGKDVLVSTSMDLHGNVSHRLAKHSDLITCYRMAPHEDAIESKRRTVANLIERFVNNTGKPKYKAWVNVPILLPGEKTSTRIEPGKSLYAKVAPTAAKEGVVDAAIWIAYAWADEPRNHAVVMVTGDDKAVVEQSAKSLAKEFWAVRNQFEFVAPTASLETCLANAIKSDKKPYFISDMGDNPTAGGAGDVSWTLTQLLNKQSDLNNMNGKMLVYASIPGKELVKKAIDAGVGNKVSGFAGAEVDSRYAPPVYIEGIVRHVFENNTNSQVVIQTGNLHIIVTESRKPFHYVRDFENLGFNPRETDIIMVKLGYLTEELYAIRGDWMMALTKGGVDQDLVNLPYKRINRPMFPFDPDMSDPDFNVVFIPLSNE